MDLWPFGKKEEDQEAAPNTAILKVPGEYKYGMRGSPEYIRIRFNEDGSVADRDKIPVTEMHELLNTGEAFMADEQQVEKIRQGDLSLSEAYQTSLQQEMKKEAEQPRKESKGYIDTKRDKSPIGGNARTKRLDKAIEDSGG